MQVAQNRWRTVDVVVASVIAVAFGVVFWAWDHLYNGPASAIPMPARALLAWRTSSVDVRSREVT